MALTTVKAVRILLIVGVALCIVAGILGAAHSRDLELGWLVALVGGIVAFLVATGNDGHDIVQIVIGAAVIWLGPGQLAELGGILLVLAGLIDLAARHAAKT